jgi:hypothetical protein
MTRSRWCFSSPLGGTNSNTKTMKYTCTWWMMTKTTVYRAWIKHGSVGLGSRIGVCCLCLVSSLNKVWYVWYCFMELKPLKSNGRFQQKLLIRLR